MSLIWRIQCQHYEWTSHPSLVQARSNTSVIVDPDHFSVWIFLCLRRLYGHHNRCSSISDLVSLQATIYPSLCLDDNGGVAGQRRLFSHFIPIRPQRDTTKVPTVQPLRKSVDVDNALTPEPCSFWLFFAIRKFPNESIWLKIYAKYRDPLLQSVFGQYRSVSCHDY